MDDSIQKFLQKSETVEQQIHLNGVSADSILQQKQQALPQISNQNVKSQSNKLSKDQQYQKQAKFNRQKKDKKKHLTTESWQSYFAQSDLRPLQQKSPLKSLSHQSLSRNLQNADQFFESICGGGEKKIHYINNENTIILEQRRVDQLKKAYRLQQLKICFIYLANLQSSHQKAIIIEKSRGTENFQFWDQLITNIIKMWPEAQMLQFKKDQDNNCYKISLEKKEQYKKMVLVYKTKTKTYSIQKSQTNLTIEEDNGQYYSQMHRKFNSQPTKKIAESIPKQLQQKTKFYIRQSYKGDKKDREIFKRERLNLKRYNKITLIGVPKKMEDYINLFTQTLVQKIRFANIYEPYAYQASLNQNSLRIFILNYNCDSQKALKNFIKTALQEVKQRIEQDISFKVYLKDLDERNIQQGCNYSQNFNKLISYFEQGREPLQILDKNIIFNCMFTKEATFQRYSHYQEVKVPLIKVN